MQTSRRAVLGAAAGMGALQLPATAKAAVAEDKRAVAELIRRSHEANAALMRGDIDGYRQFIQLSSDFSFFSPFGGEPSRAPAFTEARLQSMGKFFRNGSLETEVMAAYSSGDMVVLTIVERASVEVGGMPMQDWWLRVTLVYRHDGERWLLAHRHADPLRKGVSLSAAASLARPDA